MQLQEKIEAILFIAGEGLSVKFLAEKLEVEIADVQEAFNSLQQKYGESSGVQLIKYRDNYQFSTNPALADTVASVLRPVRERNLTRATMEAMAIVAYKQPITRAEIEEIRGVNCDYCVHVLMENNLIEVVGRKDALGKPLLYGTTDEFLKRFELESIAALPSYEELLDKLKTVASNFGSLYDRTEEQE